MWITGLYIFGLYELGQPYVIISLLAFVRLSMGGEAAGGNKERVSAYSVFNRGFHKLLGTLTAEHFEVWLIFGSE